MSAPQAAQGGQANRCERAKDALRHVGREVDVEMAIVGMGAGREWKKGGDRSSLEQPELAVRSVGPLEVLR